MPCSLVQQVSREVEWRSDTLSYCSLRNNRLPAEVCSKNERKIELLYAPYEHLNSLGKYVYIVESNSFRKKL